MQNLLSAESIALQIDPVEKNSNETKIIEIILRTFLIRNSLILKNRRDLSLLSCSKFASLLELIKCMISRQKDEHFTNQLMLSFVCFMSKWRFFEFHYLKIKIMMMDCFYFFTIAFLDSQTLLVVNKDRPTVRHGLTVRESDFLSILRYRWKINLNPAPVSLDFDIL